MTVLCIGEFMVELSQAADGTARLGFGGDTLNTAIYLARCGRHQGLNVAYATALGDDALSAGLLARWEDAGRTPCFLIGGAEGLDPAVLARADHRIALGPMTWPHFLVRGMLAEQLFRAQAIRQNHPYHRA